MNIYAFIAKKISQKQPNSLLKKETFSFTVHKIAILSIAIGLAIILVSFGILLGFKETISKKIFSFGGHIRVTEYNTNNSYEETPITINSNLYQQYKKIPAIKHVQAYAEKAGILKTDDELMGTVLKGVNTDFDKKGFVTNLQAGRFIKFSDSTDSKEIIVSKYIANKLKLKLQDTIMMYFVQNPPRYRKLHIVGIYETGMEQFDEKFIIGDLRLVQKINNWADTLVGGYEVFLKDFKNLEQGSTDVYEALDYHMEMEKITDKYAEIFDWLALLNTNVGIFLALILFVACFNIISVLLVMIMEKIQMIGILKALGATNRQIQKIFFYKGISFTVKGFALGNLLGLGLCALQYFYKTIPLDAQNYYMNTVPIAWDWRIIGLINGGMFALLLLILYIPLYVISTINPIKAIRFD